MTTAFMWRLAAFCAERTANRTQFRSRSDSFLIAMRLRRRRLANWLRSWRAIRSGLMKCSPSMQRIGPGAIRCLLPQARQRELGALRLPLTRFETEVIELESRDAAQEALFCVREDGMSMEEVAR